MSNKKIDAGGNKMLRGGRDARNNNAMMFQTSNILLSNVVVLVVGTALRDVA
ncbi:MAG: hypothetical protein PHX61_00020 [Alphaproteobacteria bacterium]|nr:hypothetical protein [Alphaproteobacteria bacterium]